MILRWAVIDEHSNTVTGRCETELVARDRARTLAATRPGTEFIVCRMVPVWSAIAPTQPVIETRITEADDER